MAELKDIFLCIASLTTLLGSLMGIAFGSYLVYKGKHFNSFDVPRITNTLDIQNDWSQVPFISIQTVPKTEACPSGTESIWERVWYGMKAGCSSYSTAWITSNKKVTSGDVCSTDDDGDYVGVNVNPFFAVYQDIFFDVRICGKTGGQNFLNWIRPDMSNTCPDGTQPCSPHTTAENTICQSDLSQCPIIDIKVVSTDTEKTDLEGKGYTTIDLSTTMYGT